MCSEAVLASPDEAEEPDVLWESLQEQKKYK